MDRQETPSAQMSVGTGAFGAAVVAATVAAMTAWVWNADVPDPVAHRLFLVVWVLGGLLLAGEVLSREARMSRRIPLLGHVFYLGLLIGAALGTTAWSDLGAAFWYQLWWGGPMATALALAAWERYRHRRASPRAQKL